MAGEDLRRSGLESFCVFVLSRLVRWDVAALAAGSGARALLEQHATRALCDELARVAEVARLSAGETVEAGQRVAGWFAQRQRLDAAESALLDLVLYDIDTVARQRLAGLMRDPPAADPVGQLLLLRAAVAAHPRHWDGLALRGDAGDALAIGLDLPAGSVPGIFLRRLASEHRSFFTSD